MTHHRSAFGTLIFSLLFSVLLGGLLSSCSDSISVEPPTPSAPARSNIKSKSAGPSIERQLYDAPRAQTHDIQDEDEAVQTLLRTAEKMLRTNDLTSANMLYQRALSVHPESIAALKGMAHIAELHEKPHEALQAYREIIRIDGENDDGHLGVAKNLMALGLNDKAIDQINKFRAIKGDNPEVLNLLGMAYTRADDIPDHFEKAIETFQTSLFIDPERLTTQNNMGFTYILAGRIQEAIELFEKLVENPRATVQHRQNLALAYGMAGRENDARKIAMQDLPRSAVEKNLLSYRKMRAKMLGVDHEVPKKPAVKKNPDNKKSDAKPDKTEQKSPIQDRTKP